MLYNSEKHSIIWRKIYSRAQIFPWKYLKLEEKPSMASLHKLNVLSICKPGISNFWYLFRNIWCTWLWKCQVKMPTISGFQRWDFFFFFFSGNITYGRYNTLKSDEKKFELIAVPGNWNTNGVLIHCMHMYVRLFRIWRCHCTKFRPGKEYNLV